MRRIPGMRTLMHKVQDEGLHGVTESIYDAAEAVGDATHLYDHHRPHHDAAQETANQNREIVAEADKENTAAANAQEVANETRAPAIPQPRAPQLFPKQSHMAAPIVMPAVNLPRRPALLDGPMREEMEIAGNTVDKAQTTGLAASAAGAIVPMMGGTGRALGTLGSGAALLSGATLGVSSLVEGGIRVAAASSEAHNQQKALAIFYVPMVAQHFNIEQEQVTFDHVTALAQQNPVFRNTLMQAYASISHNEHTEKTAGFVAPTAALGGMAATAAMVGSGPIGWIAGMAGAMGGGMLGDHLTQKVADNHPDHTAQAHIEDIAMKIEAADPAQPVTSLDVFKVRMRQHPEIAANIAERYGTDFEAMEMSQQIRLMQTDFAPQAEVAVTEAALIQSGRVDPMQLAFASDLRMLAQLPENVAAMQHSAANEKPVIGAHTERLQNQRATALEVGASALGGI